MSTLSLILGFDPIFRKKARPVPAVDDAVRARVARMFDILYEAGGIGLGANMVGSLERIAIVDLRPDGRSEPLTLINPEIVWSSDETQTFSEASLCFPGISADVTRPAAIRLTYLDQAGEGREMSAEGWLAQVIQHEVDYLDGILFPDHLSRVKRDMVMRKIRKIR
ncbi:peptide deformylase [Hwanghaeella sp.]|uniref:peptide deformylase n=1 Tax=Hwanghaeella sp. TaxID=2605943 RepID=UPI003CCBD7D7